MIKNPIQIKKILSNEDFIILKQICEKESYVFSKTEYVQKYGRYEKTIKLNSNIENKIEYSVNKELNDNYKIINTKLIKYCVIDNSIPSFRIGFDRTNLDLTCVINVSSTLIWPYCVNEFIFKNENNDAVLFNGKTSTRQRAIWKSSDLSDYSINLVLQFVKKDSSLLNIPEYIKENIFTIYPN